MLFDQAITHPMDVIQRLDYVTVWSPRPLVDMQMEHAFMIKLARYLLGAGQPIAPIIAHEEVTNPETHRAKLLLRTMKEVIQLPIGGWSLLVSIQSSVGKVSLIKSLV